MADLQAYLDEKRTVINRELAERLPGDTARPSSLHEAMRYAVLSNGKRIRPILCMAAADAAGGVAQDALTAALSIELLHAYTLVHDDMPCMDDDDTRRGRPAVHKLYGEANALLVGDALLTLAFEWMGGATPPAPYPCGAFISELAVAAGSGGVIGGQAEDIAATGHTVTADVVDYIHAHKTGALMRASVRIGAIAGGCDETALDRISTYGETVGKAFQLADDILNVTSGTDKLGKPGGTDNTRGKATYVSVHGLETAKIHAEALAENAVAALNGLPGDIEPLVLLARYVVERTR